MELFLNAFWLLLALVSFSVWWLKWSRVSAASGQRAESFRGAIGLCCVLVLLFFPISLTDDLHETPVVPEDARSSRGPLQVSKAGPTSGESGKQEAAFAAVVVAKVFCPAGVVVGRMVLAEAPSPQRTSHRLLQGRAPPFSFALAS